MVYLEAVSGVQPKNFSEKICKVRRKHLYQNLFINKVAEVYHVNLKRQLVFAMIGANAYLEYCRTYKMGLFAGIINNSKTLIILAKKLHLRCLSKLSSIERKN